MGCCLAKCLKPLASPYNLTPALLHPNRGDRAKNYTFTDPVFKSLLQVPNKLGRCFTERCFRG